MQHLDQERKNLIVFIKNPELGCVKTRLAKTLGDNKALDVYRLLLDRTRAIAQQVKAKRSLYYSKYIDDQDEWSSLSFTKYIQSGESLGDRMSIAFKKAFDEGHESVVIIGSDCFDLTSEIVEQAFDELMHKSVVIGPANDGGYYLLGMNKFIPELFQNKSWSQSGLQKETVEAINGLRLNYSMLKELTDIDEEKDLRGSSLLI